MRGSDEVTVGTRCVAGRWLGPRCFAREADDVPSPPYTAPMNPQRTLLRLIRGATHGREPRYSWPRCIGQLSEEADAQAGCFRRNIADGPVYFAWEPVVPFADGSRLLTQTVHA